MSNLRGLRLIVAVIACAAALAACGGSSPSAPTVSALDPANMVPASVVAYGEVSVRPEGSLKQSLVTLVNKVAGPGSAGKASSKLLLSFTGHAHTSIPANVRSWLGQRAGVALTALPGGQLSGNSVDEDVVLVLPTTNPAAARKYLAAHPVMHSGGTVKVVGHYVLAGGSAAVSAAAATTSSDSLANAAGYRGDVAQLGGNQLGVAYALVRPLLQAIVSRLPSTSADSLSRSAMTSELSKMPATASFAMGASVTSHSFELGFVTKDLGKTGTSTGGASSSVASLPGSSWLALALGGGLTQSKEISEFETSLRNAMNRESPLLGQAAPELKFVEHDLLPALGPMSLTVSGTSLQSLQAGFVMTPTNSSKAAPLAHALEKMVTNSQLPISVGDVKSQVIAAFRYTTAAALLHPSQTLSSNATYKQALAQLPAGSQVPLFINFGPIAALGVLDRSAKDAEVWKVAGKLSYLIAGGTHGDVRLVLGVR